MLDGILKTAKLGRAIQRSLAKVQVKPVSGGAYGGYAGGNGVYGYGNDEGLDWNKVAGLRWDNSAVFSILSFFTTCLNGTPLAVARRTSAGTYIPVPGHPVQVLLENPNPWYDGTLLTSASVFEEASRGNSYIYKHRNPNTLEVVALEYMPEGACFPYTWPGSAEWISEYRIATAQGYFRVPPCDILHLRWMTVNPYWPVLGMSPLDSALPDVAVDKLASRHEAVIIRNSGVSNISISPAKAGNGEPQPIFRDNQRTSIRDQVEDNITGDNKGRPMVWQDPTDVKTIGFDPSQLQVYETRYLSEARMCAVFSVQPVVIGLSSGLKDSNNRASIEGAIDITLQLGVLPYMRHRAKQITNDFRKEGLIGQDEAVIYDESQVSLLKDLVAKQAMALNGGQPTQTLNEIRAGQGLAAVVGGDKVGGVNVASETESGGVPSVEASDSSTETVDDGKKKVSGGPGDLVATDDKSAAVSP